MKDATGMTITTNPFEINHKSGVLKVCYEANFSASKSGFDRFARSGFETDIVDVNLDV